MKAAQTRIENSDYKKFQAKAKSLGYNVAAYLRKIILDNLKSGK